MSAYVVMFRESPVRDQAEMDEYRRKGRENPFDPKMKPLVVYGAQESIEGEPPDAVIVLEFPTVEDARTWYNSPGYQAAVPHRLKAADYRSVIVEGFTPSA